MTWFMEILRIYLDKQLQLLIELPKANQTELRITKVIKTIKSYDNLFNSCIDKKDIAI